MGHREKDTLTQRKSVLEQKLTARMSYLSGKGVEGPKTDKDTIAGKLRGDIRALNRRLRWIAANDKKNEDMARTKAEKAALPKKEKRSGKSGKAKEAPAEAKEKKGKAEKTPEGAKTKKAEGAGPAPVGKSKAK